MECPLCASAIRFRRTKSGKPYELCGKYPACPYWCPPEVAKELRETIADLKLMRDTYEPVPPHDYWTERAVLGAIILAPEETAKSLTCIHENLFYDESHARIFKSVVALRGLNRPVDILTVAHMMKSKGWDVGATLLREIMQDVPLVWNLDTYIAELRKLHSFRRMLEAATYLVKSAADTTAAPDDTWLCVRRESGRRLGKQE